MTMAATGTASISDESQDTPETSGSTRILIADDDRANRMVLSSMLEKLGYQTVAAEDGQQAVDIYNRERPDIILMDVMMPVMNGYEATKIIKSSGSKYIFTPVIFLTAITDDIALSKCIEYGGDDFLTKPINFVILKSKIDALLRVSALYSELERHKTEIESHHARLQQEHMIAENVFSRIMDSSSLTPELIKYIIRPQSITSGDMLLASATPFGSFMLLVGDFTGHGLSAALGALPTSDIFYAMSRKGFSLGRILQTINEKLYHILPTEFYLAATAIEFSPRHRAIKIWNGGLPNALIKGSDGHIRKFPSISLPMGITEGDNFSKHLSFTPLYDNDKIYIYTDGLTEAVDKDGKMFGEDSLTGSIAAQGSSFEDILQRLNQHTADAAQQDDITLAEISFDKFSLPDDSATARKKLNEWNESLRIDGSDIIKIDPVQYLFDELCLLPGLKNQHFRINFVLNELYSNAVDHGILGLQSMQKNTAQGFFDYYQEREQRLTRICETDNNCYITFDISYRHNDESTRLDITVANSGEPIILLSGDGDYDDSSRYFGRGLELVKHFSQDISLDRERNSISVVILGGAD